MKKLVTSLFILFFLKNFCFSQLKYSSNGNLGIGTYYPGYKLDVSGSARFHNWTDVIIDWSGICCGTPTIYPTTDWYLQLGKSQKRIGTIFVQTIYLNNSYYYSDDSIKTNKASISDPIGKILQLNGKQYYYTDTYLNFIPDTPRMELSGKQYGFMAREVQQYLPELVNVDRETGRYSLNYIGIIPILTEGIKSQQNQINQLNSLLTRQNNTIDSLKAFLIMQQETIDALSISVSQIRDCTGCNNDFFINRTKIKKSDEKKKNNETEDFKNNNSIIPILYQNTPNPFTESTEIKYYLPENFNKALITIYNLNGEQLESYSLINSGLQSIKISGNWFKPGSYYYSLIVNNKEIDTKKLIIIK